MMTCVEGIEGPSKAEADAAEDQLLGSRAHTLESQISAASSGRRSCSHALNREPQTPAKPHGLSASLCLESNVGKLIVGLAPLE